MMECYKKTFGNGSLLYQLLCTKGKQIDVKNYCKSCKLIYNLIIGDKTYKFEFKVVHNYEVEKLFCSIPAGADWMDGE